MSETEGQPISSGGWWTPYVETYWGYFRFAVRPEEQPDGLILFWHDAEGAHSQSVIFDTPPRPNLLRRVVDALRAQLGHGKRDVTDHYARVLPELQRAAADRLGDALG